MRLYTVGFLKYLNFVLPGILIVWWMIESVCHIYVFEHSTLPEYLSKPGSMEIWTDLLLIGFAFLVLWICVKMEIKRRQGIEESLRYEIAKRATVEMNLRNEISFNETILDTMNTLLVILDHRGNIVGFNKTCERCTGYSFEEVKNRPFFDLFLLPEEKEEVRSTFERLVSEKFPGNNICHWMTKDGNKILIDWSSAPSTDQEGNLVNIIATGIDITETRKVQEAIETVNQRLTDIVEFLPDADFRH